MLDYGEIFQPKTLLDYPPQKWHILYYTILRFWSWFFPFPVWWMLLVPCTYGTPHNVTVWCWPVRAHHAVPTYDVSWLGRCKGADLHRTKLPQDLRRVALFFVPKKMWYFHVLLFSSYNQFLQSGPSIRYVRYVLLVLFFPGTEVIPSHFVMLSSFGTRPSTGCRLAGRLARGWLKP